ncbi:MAG: HlyD family efflux transporter periplasmic adaptor subunit [Planctomycetia bacterium]|nr:HlyD family efflux transporter periplasmic adaptor subunit [Planctomycetia bacterium]
MTAALFALHGFAVVLALTGPGDADSNDIHVYPCAVTAIDEIEVPAEEAGVLVSLEARPGLLVEEGTRLGQVDARGADLQKRIAQAEHLRAKEQAENDIKVRYAKAVEKTAEADYLQAVEANRKVAGAVQQSDLRKRLLEYNSATLSVESAQLDQKLAQMQLESKSAALDDAELALNRRQIVARLGGVVVDVRKRRGEWVHPGDPILRILRMDRLQVDGFLEASEHGPQDVAGRPVRVAAALERGRVEAFVGKIVFVDPVVQQDGTYRVRAEVTNRQVGDQWVLRPGLTAEMWISPASLDGSPQETTSARRAMR